MSPKVGEVVTDYTESHPRSQYSPNVFVDSNFVRNTR
jgi:hypothetical protein